MNYPFQAVIFDYGNVLCPMPEPAAFETLAKIAGIPSSVLVKSLWQYRLEYDRGALDGPSYWRQIATDHGRKFSEGQIQRLIEFDLGLWTNPGPTLLGWARSLRSSGLKTSILSNMPCDFSRYLRSHAQWLNDFDHYVFSGELGITKPDARIFRACLEGLHVAPSQALFIDDMAANVDGACALGMKAIRFESLAQLAADILPLGLPRLPV